MKKLVTLAVCLLFLASCTTRLSVQKRRYLPGYYVDVIREKQPPVPIHQAHPADCINPLPLVKANSLESIVSEGVENGTVESGARASKTRKPDSSAFKPTELRVMLPRHSRKSRIAAVSLKTASLPTNFYSAPRSIVLPKRFAGRSLEPILLSPDETRSGNPGLRGVGIAFMILGFLILLLVSILIGAILLLLGLILLLAGLGGERSSSPHSSSRRKEDVLQDVVYLKNGSIIRGMIIEQVPNASLKIQTSDGSIFVYEIDQVLKMTREAKP